MSAVVDTGVLIDALRANGPAVETLASLYPVPICSEISRVEILRGMRSAERQATQALLEQLMWVPLDQAISARAGELGRRYRASYPGLGAADLVVAATALHLNRPLITTNVRHFPMFEDLKPPY